MKVPALPTRWLASFPRKRGAFQQRSWSSLVTSTPDDSRTSLSVGVIPAQVGIHRDLRSGLKKQMDSRVRGNDGGEELAKSETASRVLRNDGGKELAKGKRASRVRGDDGGKELAKSKMDSRVRGNDGKSERAPLAGVLTFAQFRQPRMPFTGNVRRSRFFKFR